MDLKWEKTGMENTIKMDDFGGTPISGNLHLGFRFFTRYVAGEAYYLRTLIEAGEFEVWRTM